MFFRLLLLFTVVPLAELWLLIRIGSRTSATFTIGLVLVTGIVGASLARRQGLQTWQRLQQELAAGKVPSDTLQDGLMILIAGAVLITPGIITDLLGFALLVPPFRALMKRGVAAWLKSHAVVQVTHFHGTESGPAGGSPQQPPTVIDAEFTRHPTDDE